MSASRKLFMMGRCPMPRSIYAKMIADYHQGALQAGVPMDAKGD
jgi:hypothetical protein